MISSVFILIFGKTITIEIEWMIELLQFAPKTDEINIDSNQKNDRWIAYSYHSINKLTGKYHKKIDIE